MTQPIDVDVDAIMKEIRAELSQQPGLARAAHQKANGLPSVDSSGTQVVALTRNTEPAHLLPVQPEYSLEDLLQFHDEDFIRNAYRTLLGREPDPVGAGRFLAELRTGAMAKTEVLGRIRYSPEGRARSVRVTGLRAPFALRTARRVPVIGAVLASVQYLLTLPVLGRNLERLETVAFMHERQSRQRTDRLADEVRAALNTILQRAGSIEGQLRGLADDIIGVHARSSSEREALEAQVALKAERIELQDAELRLRADGTALEKLLSEARSALDTLESRLVSLEQGTPHRSDALALLERRIELGNQDVWIKLGVLSEQMIAREREILEQERRLVALLDQARQRASEGIPEPAPAIVARERAHLNDRHYFEFEERFRGTPDDISDRLRVYLPHVRQAAAVTAGAPVLDVGCGRGEWLELLRQEGLAAKGVDNNRTMVAELGARGLQATEADAIEFLRGLEPGSLGAITAFHVIEHLPFEQMLTLFAECWRALQPGGIAIFETPNPENLVVGACNFWCDPTHLRPLPPEPTRFALESRGFRDVAILRLHPAHNAPETNAPEGAFEQAVHDRLYGAQDYALIGYRR